MTSLLNRIRIFELAQPLAQFLARGGVLVGVSAGAMILGPTIELVRFFGENLKGTDPAGLGFVPFEVFPHWSEHSLREKELRRYCLEKNRKVFVLNDGEVVTANGTKVKHLDALGSQVAS